MTGSISRLRGGLRARAAGLALGALVAGGLAIQPVQAEGLLDSIDNEDIGRIVGGVGGAVLGSQFGKGTGKAVAVGAGALGGLFLGGEIGKRVGGSDQEQIVNTRQQALESDRPVTWRNPDSGVQSTARVTETAYRPAPVVTTKPSTGSATPKNDVVWRVPPMQLIGADYRATTTSNIRGGPSTDYAVMGQLKEDERVHVVGKVADRDWYMISRNGIGSGFVYGDLLRRIPGSGGDMARPQSTASLDNVRECSVIEQQVTLSDGTQETRRARACRTADGNWELI